MIDKDRRNALKKFGTGVLLASGASVGTVTANGGPATVTFNEQDARGVTVNVAETFLPDGGFIAVHDDRLLDGKPLASVVGHSAYKQPGTHTDLRVSVDRDEVSQGENLLIAMPHRNTNTSRKYDFVTSGGAVDGPYIDSDDTNEDGVNVVIDSARVTF